MPCAQEAIAAAPEVVGRGACNVHKRAPLHVAASLGRLEAMEALLQAGAPVNATDGHGMTALQVGTACAQGFFIFPFLGLPKITIFLIFGNPR